MYQKQLCSGPVSSQYCCWPPQTSEAAALYDEAAAAAAAEEAPALALQSHLLENQELPCRGPPSPATAGCSPLASSSSILLPAEHLQRAPILHKTLGQSGSSSAVAAIPPPAAAAAADAYARHRSDLFWAGDIIDGRFQVIKRLADGGFAVVYSATDLTTHDEVAVKVVCHCTTGAGGCLPPVIKWRTVLADEYLVYQHLGAVTPDTPPPGIPSVLGMGKELLLPVPGSTTGRCSLFSYLAMERLGLDLCELSAEQLYGADATCSQFVDHGLQMLQALHSMHKLGLVHADVKPENFAISHAATSAAGSCCSLSSSAGALTCSTDRHRVYLLDMGFAHPWQDGLPNLPRRPKFYVGTPATSSISSMYRQGRVMPRDDCEALGYTLLELWLGEMPWALTTNVEAAAGWSQERLQEMAQMKDSLIRQGIAEGTLPRWFHSWWTYITHPDLAGSPVDYQHLAGIINSIALPRPVPTGSTLEATASAATSAATAGAPAAAEGEQKAACAAKAAAAAAARLLGEKVTPIPKQMAASSAAATPAPAAAAGIKRNHAMATTAGDAAAASAAAAVSGSLQRLKADGSLLEEIRAAKQPKLYHKQLHVVQQQRQEGEAEGRELNSLYKMLLMDVGQKTIEE